jgi:lipid II:glycine glycyltransferase (peptidoglycan interpeptide bridge formation enzyme)
LNLLRKIRTSYASLPPGEMSVSVDKTIGAEEEREVTAFVEASPSGSYLQLPSWPRHLPKTARWSYRILRCRVKGRLSATGVVRLTTLAPGVHLASIRRGPVTNSPADLDAALPTMLGALRDVGVCTVVLNPRWEDAAADDALAILRRVGATVMPRSDQSLHVATAVVSLRAGEQEMLASFKKRCRRDISKAKRVGVVVSPVRTAAEADLYAPIMKEFHRSRGLSLDAVPSVEAQWELTRKGGVFLLAWHAGKVIAGHTVLAVGNRAYCLSHSSVASDASIPKSYLLDWEAMRICRAEGIEQYDLAGAPSPRDPVNEGERKRFLYKSAFNPTIVRLTPAVSIPLLRPEHDVLFGLRQRFRHLRSAMRPDAAEARRKWV